MKKLSEGYKRLCKTFVARGGEQATPFRAALRDDTEGGFLILSQGIAPLAFHLLHSTEWWAK